jgi:hypothetical protein
VLLGGGSSGGFLLRGGSGRTGRDGAADEAADQSANTGAVVIALSVTAPDLLGESRDRGRKTRAVGNGAEIAEAESATAPVVAIKTTFKM